MTATNFLLTSRTIDGQAFSDTANLPVIAPATHAATSKTTPVDADELPLVDSAASNVLKKLTWANLKAALSSLFVPKTSSAICVYGTDGSGNQTTYPFSFAASAFAATFWDGNANLSARAFLASSTSTPTSGGTTTLTIASTQVQVLTGSTTHTVKLPTSGIPAGMTYTVSNQSSGVVTVQSSAANTITTVAAGSGLNFQALVDTPTTAAHWRYF